MVEQASMVVEGSTAEAVFTVVGAAGKYLPQPTERHERPAAQTAGRFVCVPSMFDSLEVKVLYSS